MSLAHILLLFIVRKNSLMSRKSEIFLQSFGWWWWVSGLRLWPFPNITILKLTSSASISSEVDPHKLRPSSPSCSLLAVCEPLLELFSIRNPFVIVTSDRRHCDEFEQRLPSCSLRLWEDVFSTPCNSQWRLNVQHSLCLLMLMLNFQLERLPSYSSFRRFGLLSTGLFALAVRYVPFIPDLKTVCSKDCPSANSLPSPTRTICVACYSHQDQSHVDRALFSLVDNSRWIPVDILL